MTDNDAPAVAPEPMDDEALTALVAAARAATPGPWYRQAMMERVDGANEVIDDLMDEVALTARMEDAEYVSLANPSAILALAARCGAAEAERDRPATIEQAARRLARHAEPAWWGEWLGVSGERGIRCIYCNRIGATVAGVHPPQSECPADELDAALAAEPDAGAEA